MIRGFQKYALFLLLSYIPFFQARADQNPEWNPNRRIPRGGISNPYELSPKDLQSAILNGKRATLHYPVSVTGILLPYHPLERFLRADTESPLRWILQKFVQGFQSLHSFENLEDWLGLVPFPQDTTSIPTDVPEFGQHHMGLTIIDSTRGAGFTISCAQCHTSNLFGRAIIGGTTRFPRANELFATGLQVAPLVSGSMFQMATEASDSETQMFEDSRYSMGFIQARQPRNLGLDTSLAQVALSLALRQPDPWATRIKPAQPGDPGPIEQVIADSKPAVWWNAKYKDRYLSDGSVVSGNPIYTNFLWNEIGRGTDLHRLEDWLDENSKIIRDLTTAVFSSEAPSYTDFFDPNSIDENQARHGELIFNQNCARCHGHYEKVWSEPGAELLNQTARMKTLVVNYGPHTPVVDVGTDPGRYQGMQSLTVLNRLELSRRHQIYIQPQHGYVPPPLVGIWARWPYFHNNSAPSLCAVLTRASVRPRQYWAREAVDPKQDFDEECNGYPTSKPAVPSPAEYSFDTDQPGLSNQGHDEGIFLRNGQELLSPTDKKDLIQFLKTL